MDTNAFAVEMKINNFSTLTHVLGVIQNVPIVENVSIWGK
jgi:hypothetical protein